MKTSLPKKLAIYRNLHRISLYYMVIHKLTVLKNQETTLWVVIIIKQAIILETRGKVLYASSDEQETGGQNGMTVMKSQSEERLFRQDLVPAENRMADRSSQKKLIINA